MNKKKKGIIITIVIIAVLVVAIGTLAVLYFMTDLFKSEQQLFWKYFSSNSKITEVLSSENEEIQRKWKESNSYISQGDLNLSITKENGTQEIVIGTTSKHNQANGRTYSDATLYNGEEELLKFSYINCDDIYALQCKDIYEPYYIGVRNSNLKEFATNLGLSDEEIAEIPDSIPLNVTENASKITDEESQYLSDTYLAVLMNSISEERYTKTEKTNITINNQNYEAAAYKLTLTEQDIKQMAINVLTKAKEDAQTIAILNKLVYDENQTEQINVQETIEQLLEELQNEDSEESTNVNDVIGDLYGTNENTNEDSEDKNFVISVYHVGKQIIKTQINYNNETEYILDLDLSQENKKYVTLDIRDIENTEDSVQGTNLELAIEKQILNNMVTYTTNITNDENGYKITMTNALGNVVNNQINNNSRITISDDNVLIDVSYYKTMELATEEVEIQELTNANAVIINNYPMDQLEIFFENLGEKAEQVLTSKMGQLNIKIDF